MCLGATIVHSPLPAPSNPVADLPYLVIAVAYKSNNRFEDVGPAERISQANQLPDKVLLSQSTLDCALS